MYASAMTLLERRDGEAGASYLDLAEFISDHGAQEHVEEDLHQLFRRVVFNVIVGNRDDHLRNHGFIREPSGWRLSPAFDINPSTSKQHHALAIGSHRAEPDLSNAMAQAELYRLNAGEAQRVLEQVRAAVSSWRNEAGKLRLPSVEIQRMESIIQA